MGPRRGFLGKGAQSHPRPHQLLVEGNLRFGRRNLGEEGCKGLDEIEEPYCKVSTALATVYMAKDSDICGAQWHANGADLRPLILAILPQCGLQYL